MRVAAEGVMTAPAVVGCMTDVASPREPGSDGGTAAPSGEPARPDAAAAGGAATPRPSPSGGVADVFEIVPRHLFDEQMRYTMPVINAVAAVGALGGDLGRRFMEQGGHDGLHIAHGFIVKVLEVFRPKWTFEVLISLWLLDEPRFTELHRAIKGVSHRTLSDRLAELETREWITRRVSDGRPPAVHYALAPDGARVLNLLRPLIGELVFQQIGVSEGRETPDIHAAHATMNALYGEWRDRLPHPPEDA